MLHILIVNLNPPETLKRLMLDAVIEGHKRFPNAGSTVGVNATNHNFAVLGTPLTDEQITGVRYGSQALFFVVGGVWRDNSNEFHYWVDGRRAYCPNFPNMDDYFWRGI
jgi:hypothetical protein